MRGLSRTLKETVRKLAYRTSVDQLRKQGVQRVNVLGLDRIVSLIEEAVHRSLRHKLVGFERERIADATKEEFVRLLRSNQDLTRSRNEALRLKQRAEEQVDELRRELARQRQALREKLDLAAAGERARYAGEDAEIIAKLDEVLGAVADDPAGALPQLRGRVLELMMNVVGKEREEAVRARELMRDREVDLLERRISKLNVTLQDTESRLSHIASLKNVEDGISSIYRDVQGISAEDAQYRKKKDLMETIFRANLALQKGM